jgi:hypothetical protein
MQFKHYVAYFDVPGHIGDQHGTAFHFNPPAEIQTGSPPYAWAVICVLGEQVFRQPPDSGVSEHDLDDLDDEAGFAVLGDPL